MARLWSLPKKRESSALYVGDISATIAKGIVTNSEPVLTMEGNTFANLAWTTNGRLLAYDQSSQNELMRADGSERSRLLEGDANDGPVEPCGGDDAAVLERYVDDPAKASIWTLNPSTGTMQQIVAPSTPNFGDPICSSDGKWIFYPQYHAPDGWKIMKVAFAGGTPVEMSSVDNTVYAISRDGSQIVFLKHDNNGDANSFLLRNIQSGTIVQHFPAPISADDLAFMPDGKAFTYLARLADSSMQLMLQPLAGGPPLQLTHFDAEHEPYAYAWSQDGKKIAMSVNQSHFDAVMFTGFR